MRTLVNYINEFFDVHDNPTINSFNPEQSIEKCIQQKDFSELAAYVEKVSDVIVPDEINYGDNLCLIGYKNNKPVLSFYTPTILVAFNPEISTGIYVNPTPILNSYIHTYYRIDNDYKKIVMYRIDDDELVRVIQEIGEQFKKK